MADTKVYTNEVVPEQPFPQADVIDLSASSGGGQVVTSPKTNDSQFPVKRVASELLSTALNTKAQKIYKDFQLQDTGGIRAGEYIQGVSGEVAMTPNGLTAKNQDGETTVGIDATTGDAFFKGEVRARDFVISDQFGLKSIGNFESNFYADDSSISTTSSSFADVSGSSLSFSLDRETNVLISFYSLVNTFGSLANFTYRTDVCVAIDGVEQSPFAGAGWWSTTALAFAKQDTVSGTRIYRIAEGEHTIKLRWRTTSADGAEMYTRNINYVILGR